MDILIPVSGTQIEKEIKLDDLPLASSYAKDAIVNQRKRINEIILANVDKSYPAVQIPFELLFTEIEQEMWHNGWCKQDGGWWHPIGLKQQQLEVKIKDEANQIISAELFYNSTIKHQLKELYAELDKAREDGLRSVRLKFPLYYVIVDKLQRQGWTVYVYNRFYSSVEPYTIINPQKS